MKNIFLGCMSIFLSVSVLVLLSSCEEEDDKLNSTLAVETATVTSSAAIISVDYSGDAPYVSRMMTLATDDLESLGIDLDDEEATAYYIGTNGTAIVPPCSSTVTGLSPDTEYICIAVCWDWQIEVLDVAYYTFTTPTPSNAIGSGSGAGSVNEGSF